MIVYRVDAHNPEPDFIRAAADAIRRGELVIYPTETVYGLGADALNEAAVRRAFEAKGRQTGLAMPVLVGSANDVVKVASSMPRAAQVLAGNFWPGPLTLVLPKRAVVSDLVSGGAATIGVRVPDHAVALALLNELGTPITGTSANMSGNAPAANASDAMQGLEDAVEVVLDAGETPCGVPSTVLDVTCDPPRVLRRGAIGIDR
ncbi:MAG: threonylcarbamoyl-AMP synthase, partial [Armatimonadetes bacterium RBG_16_58_9]